jgi:hypothetical protein
MKYVSIDLETTCIDPKCPENILQIAMVVEDTTVKAELKDLPSFCSIVIPESSSISGSLTALSMNAWLLIAIEMYKKNDAHEVAKYFLSLGVPPQTVERALDARFYNHCYGQDKIWKRANEFLDEHFGVNSKNIIIAGKNVAGFDIPFLHKDFKRRFAHRVIDPASVFIDWSQKTPPSSADLQKRFNTDPVSHDAYGDAIDVIAWLRPTTGE